MHQMKGRIRLASVALVVIGRVIADRGAGIGVRSIAFPSSFRPMRWGIRPGSGGFEVGVGPTVVVVDEGKAKTMTTTTAKDDIYAFIFGQKGLMAGLGIQGNKITKINPK